MKICLTSMLSPWDEGSGGGQLIVHNLANSLRRRGHEVYVIYSSRLKRPLSSGLKAEYTSLFVRFFERRSLNIFPVTFRVFRLSKNKRFDVVHSTGPEGCLFRMVIGKGVKFISSTYNPNVPNLTFNPLQHNLISFLKTIYRFKLFYLERLALRMSDLVVAISNFSLRNINQNYNIPKKKMRVVYCGVDSTLFFPVREKSDSPEREILFVGRLDEQKGISTLIKAFYLIKDKFDVRLRLIGNGYKQNEYLKSVSALGMQDRVVFNGGVPNTEVPIFLNRASLFVLPSIYESFGLVLLEAGACEVPVVSTSVGSIPEIIIDRKTGVLVPPNDPNRLAGAISELLADEEKAKEMARSARAALLEKFTWEKSAKELESIYSTSY